jgi:hypothetical protein
LGFLSLWSSGGYAPSGLLVFPLPLSVTTNPSMGLEYSFSLLVALPLWAPHHACVGSGLDLVLRFIVRDPWSVGPAYTLVTFMMGGSLPLDLIGFLPIGGSLLWSFGGLVLSL